jgi:hypothetical protein
VEKLHVFEVFLFLILAFIFLDDLMLYVTAETLGAYRVIIASIGIFIA